MKQWHTLYVSLCFYREKLQPATTHTTTAKLFLPDQRAWYSQLLGQLKRHRTTFRMYVFSIMYIPWRMNGSLSWVVTTGHKTKHEDFSKSWLTEYKLAIWISNKCHNIEEKIARLQLQKFTNHRLHTLRTWFTSVRQSALCQENIPNNYSEKRGVQS